MFITAILQALRLPVLTSALIMQTLDRVVGTNFFGLDGRQRFHRRWWGRWAAFVSTSLLVYSHPAVYVMILPAMGMVSDIIATFSHRPVWLQMVFAIAGIAGLGFIVWGHPCFSRA